MDEAEASAAAAATAQPPKQTVSYDKYISIVNMLVQRVAEDETAGSGEGVDGEALVQWYLEQKEDEMQGEEDYHEEMALARKVLKKMVKVCFVALLAWVVENDGADIGDRTTSSWRSEGREWRSRRRREGLGRGARRRRQRRRKRGGLSMCCILIVRWRSIERWGYT